MSNLELVSIHIFRKSDKIKSDYSESELSLLFVQNTGKGNLTDQSFLQNDLSNTMKRTVVKSESKPSTSMKFNNQNYYYTEEEGLYASFY